MNALRERDVRSALELVYDAGTLTCQEPFPREFLERLSHLIPADAIVGYHEGSDRRSVPGGRGHGDSSRSHPG